MNVGRGAEFLCPLLAEAKRILTAGVDFRHGTVTGLLGRETFGHASFRTHIRKAAHVRSPRLLDFRQVFDADFHDAIKGVSEHAV